MEFVITASLDRVLELSVELLHDEDTSKECAVLLLQRIMSDESEAVPILRHLSSHATRHPLITNKVCSLRGRA
jgi:hypothetical protein